MPPDFDFHMRGGGSLLRSSGQTSFAALRSITLGGSRTASPLRREG